MKVSLIIPALNEADRIGEAVVRARQAGADEVIVIDGESDDGTFAAAHAADLVLTSRRGRAAQQNRGAESSTGDILVFVHADCWLEPGGVDEIRAALQDPRCAGGCFRQIIDAAGCGYRLLEWGNALRVRWCRWSYGDQGIFLRRELFQSLGGFPDLPFMEDLYLMKQLKRQARGSRWVLLSPRLHVSPRRWQQRGLFRQTVSNWKLILLAHLGVPLERLHAQYRAVR